METIRKNLLCSTSLDKEVSAKKGKAFTIPDSLRSTFDRPYPALVKEMDLLMMKRRKSLKTKRTNAMRQMRTRNKLLNQITNCPNRHSTNLILLLLKHFHHRTNQSRHHRLRNSDWNRVRKLCRGWFRRKLPIIKRPDNCFKQRSWFRFPRLWFNITDPPLSPRRIFVH